MKHSNVANEAVVPESLPDFLSSFENITAHFDEHFGPHGSNKRGDTFLDLALKVIDLSPENEEFPSLAKNPKKSHDGGVDLYSTETEDGKLLCAQSKYKIRSKDELDQVLSKFKDFEEKNNGSTNRTLFEEEEESEGSLIFALVTSSKLEGILKKYEASSLASKDYYERLLAEDRLIKIDGPRILQLLQQLYRKTHLIPSTVELASEEAWHQCGNVYLGTVSGQTLVDLYEQHGDALFFENIRDFLGTTSGKVVTTRSTVNQEIINTIRAEPSKMLARNNGLTFRATSVEVSGKKKLELSMAAIVNGCQTTMCLVHCVPLPKDCMVQVKIVETSDAWDIAKAANYQNQVTRVDLDLARYIRPQLVRQNALVLGYAIDSGSSDTASSILNTIYQTQVDYEELKVLVLGLFSRKPNNLFENNYAELRSDVLERLYDDGQEERFFGVLLLILKESRIALEKCKKTFGQEEYKSIFKRFYSDDKPRYRVLMAISALCAMLRDDISERSSNSQREFARTTKFLDDARDALENRPDEFHAAYLIAFLALADLVLDLSSTKPGTEIAQNMYTKISSTSFSSLYKKILMRMDAQESLQKNS